MALSSSVHESTGKNKYKNIKNKADCLVWWFSYINQVLNLYMITFVLYLSEWKPGPG